MEVETETKFEGTYRYGLRNGKGVLFEYFPILTFSQSGNREEGNWTNGKREGMFKSMIEQEELQSYW